MRIAVLAPLEYPIREPYAGGLEKHTAQLAGGLAARGHRVTLLALAGTQVAEGVELLVRSPRDYRGLGALLARGDYDLLHNNSVHYLPTLVAHRLPRPVVTTLHTPPYRSLRVGALASRLFDGSTFVAISHALGRRWRPYVGRYTVVHNAVDATEWAFSPTAPPRTAVWYGRLTPEKGAEYAIAAARRAGYTLELAGPRYDRRYFAATVAPLLGDDVRYHGHLEQHKLAELVGRASVGLFTSVWEEPFGLAPVEMLACGTPVAAFRSGAVGELLTPATGKIVDKRDVGALARAMVETAFLPRKGCRDHILATFTPERMLVAYESVYAEAINRGRDV